MTFYYSNRFYPIRMEWRRLSILFSAAFLLFFAGIMIETGSIWLDIGLKTLVGLSYPVVLYVMRLFDESEIDRLKKIIKTRRLSFD